MRRVLVHLISLGLLLGLGALLLLPIWQIVEAGFFRTVAGQRAFTFDHFEAIFSDPDYRQGLVNSLKVAAATTTVCLLVSVPLAMISVRCDYPAKRLFGGLVLVPMILPPFVGAIGMLKLLAREGGALNMLLRQIGVLGPSDTIDWLGGSSFWGVVVLEALHLYPILYLNVQAALANIDPAMEEAARNLGASGLRLFRRITLPLMMPGVFAGSTIVFIWSFTELGTPLMMKYRQITAVQVFDGLNKLYEAPETYALVVVLLAASSLIYVVGRLVLGRSAAAMTTKATIAAGTRKLRGPAGLAALLPFALITFLAVLPHVSVVLLSIAAPDGWNRTVLPARYTWSHHLEAIAKAVDPRSAEPCILNSLKYASASTALDLAVGFAIAYLVIRTRAAGRRTLDALAMLPLAVPGLVIAFGYFVLAQPGHLLARFNPETDPTVLLILAYAVRRLPYVVRCSAAGLQQTSVTLEEAARNLGASPLRSIRRITLPLVAANLVAGGLMAFSFAMLEVSDSLILAVYPQDYPITKTIYVMVTDRPGEGPFVASALGVWGMILLAATLVGASLLLGKRLGAVFRI